MNSENNGLCNLPEMPVVHYDIVLCVIFVSWFPHCVYAVSFSFYSILGSDP